MKIPECHTLPRVDGGEINNSKSMSLSKKPAIFKAFTKYYAYKLRMAQIAKFLHHEIGC